MRQEIRAAGEHTRSARPAGYGEMGPGRDRTLTTARPAPGLQTKAGSGRARPLLAAECGAGLEIAQAKPVSTPALKKIP